eukprot:7801606-Alexandrium_andersonii.AAC.1
MLDLYDPAGLDPRAVASGRGIKVLARGDIGHRITQGSLAATSAIAYLANQRVRRGRRPGDRDQVGGPAGLLARNDTD